MDPQPPILSTISAPFLSHVSTSNSCYAQCKAQIKYVLQGTVHAYCEASIGSQEQKTTVVAGFPKSTIAYHVWLARMQPTLECKYAVPGEGLAAGHPLPHRL